MARKHHWVSVEEDDNGCIKPFCPEDYSISLHISTFRSLVNAEALAQIRRLSSPKSQKSPRLTVFYYRLWYYLKRNMYAVPMNFDRRQLQYFFFFALLMADICELNINLKSKVKGPLAWQSSSSRATVCKSTSVLVSSSRTFICSRRYSIYGF